MKQCPQVGGQAVLEGVMMRCPGSLAVAVRRPGGQIVVRDDAWRSIWHRFRFLRWPFLRGGVVMIEAMVNGMQALSFSAKEAMPEQEKEGDGGRAAGLGFSLAIGIILVLLLFKVVPHLAATYAGNLLVGRPLTVDDVLYHLVDGVVKVLIFVGYIVAISTSKDIKRVFMYHGAEHMAIFTLEAGEELTVENASRKSTVHPRCGTAFLMVVILLFIVVAAILMPFVPAWAKPTPGGGWYRHIIVVLFKLPLLIPVAGMAYEFNRFAGRHADNRFLRPLLWPGLAMQLLTTKRPTADQIEVALVAMQTAMRRENAGAAPSAEPVVFDDYSAFSKIWNSVGQEGAAP
jgi:uncharacterized protein YqhQ